MDKNERITDLDSLLREKYRVTVELESCKKDLHHSMLYLKHNHKAMIWGVINPLDKDTSLGNILGTVKSTIGPVLQSALGTATSSKTGGTADISVTLALLAAESIKSWLEKRKQKRNAKNESSANNNHENEEVI